MWPAGCSKRCGDPYALGHGAEALVTTSSMGISVASDPARSPGDLYREADLALYRAKDAGRDQYALYDDELRARADRRMAAETLLRKAISDNLLVPVFQPIVDLGDGRVRAAEALVADPGRRPAGAARRSSSTSPRRPG